MQKDDGTWLKLAYGLSGALIALFFWKAFMFFGTRMGFLEQNEAALRTGSLIVAILLGGLSLWLLARKEERHQYFLASIGELRKVSWPTWDNTKKLTWIVVVVVAIFAVILASLDGLFAWAWSGFLRVFVV